MMDRAHVMALTPERQDALWLLLYNFHGMFALGQMQKLADPQDDKGVQARHALLMTNLDHTLEIMKTIEEVRKGSRRVRTFFFSPRAMNVIGNCVQFYDEKANTLNVDDNRVVSAAFAGLRDLVATAMQFCYTREELRKVGIK